jgi:alpha-beta hydrolase superfamily lysophospholipase
MSKRALFRVALGVAALAVLWIGTAAVLIFRPDPQFTGPPMPTMARSGGVAGSQTREFTMRDGAKLRALEFASPDAATTVVLIHGVMSSARLMATLASRLREEAGAEVLALDLRGHGASDGAPGDVAYVGQYEDDVADVVDAIKQVKPQQRIVLAGYSMGGGITLRYADRKHLPPVDGYLLLAPHIGQSSPTTRTDPVDAATVAASPMQVHVSRTIGLAMLDTLGLRWWSDKPTLFFNVAADAPLSRYSFRAMVGTTPANHRAALEADAQPLLAIVGSKDESFHVDRFPDVIRLHQNGTLHVVEGPTHFTLLYNKPAAAVAGAWIRERG